MTPLLVYDGDCGFCRYTVAYAEALSGPAVEYRPYQELGSDTESDPRSDPGFAASIQLFIDDARHGGARAAFEVLGISGRGGWLWLYRHVPGLAAVFEWLYTFISTHREGSYRLARWSFGKRLGPRRHEQTADWLYRGIALCGLVAFASFWWQVEGLIGSGGILPAARFLDAVAASYGWERFWLLPTLFWLGASNPALHLVCAVGVLATVAGLIGRCRATAAIVGYLSYLSLIHAGQVFTSYQWDILLTECFVLAAILARAPTLGIWVARLLLFRFMLLSGAVKLLSGDPTWADASALAYHFETQPLPTALAWYAHRLPDALLRWGVYATFLIELVLPFFILGPRNLRLVAGIGFLLLQLLILLTGSYNFFNLLTIVLCLSLLDDAAPGSRAVFRLRGIASVPKRRWITVTVAGWIMVQGLVLTAGTLTRSAPPGPVRAAAPLMIANGYGLFAVMTTTRDELSIEGSDDGHHWLPYRFPYKPGPVEEAPRLATPHQPRLDWQMWFAALGAPEHAPWIYDFAYALLEGRPAVLKLIDSPFPEQPPRFIRIQRARYRFTTPGERKASGAWWSLGSAEAWLPSMRLRTPTISHEPLELARRWQGRRPTGQNPAARPTTGRTP